jgi:hypothetical protein
VRQGPTDEEIVRHLKLADTGLFELLDVPRGDALAGLDDDLLAGLDIEAGGVTAQTRRHQGQLDLLLADLEGVLVEEQIEDLRGPVAQRAQQDGRRQLAATVDTHVDHVLWIELEVQPGAAVGNDPCREQQLP